MVKTEKIPEGYRATEAGILPVDWQVKRLSEVATELTERAGQDKYETVSISAGIGFVNQAEKFGKELSGKQYEKYIVLHQSDFSYNKGNSKTSPQGCIYRLNDRETAAVPNVFESFRIECQNADYYEQLFLSGFLNKQLYSKINRGVRDDGLLNLTGKDFYSCTVPVPPIVEQKKIAEVLSCCDRVIELKQQLIAELQRLKSGFLQAMFPAKGHSEPNIRFLEFSDAWEQRKLEDTIPVVTDYVAAGSFGDIAANVDYKSEPDYAQLVRTVDLKHNFENNDSIYVNKNAFDYLYRVNLDEESIVLPNIGANIGEVYYIKPSELPYERNVLGPNAIYLKTNKNTKFIYSLFQTADFQKKLSISVASSGQPKFNKTELKGILLTLPNNNEQQRIGDYFFLIDHLITLHQRELEETKKKKKSLAKLLLTGSVRVPT